MQKKVLSLVLAVMPWIAIAQPKNNDWENPTLPSFNTVTPHAWFVPYPDEPAAIQQQSGANILSLDGIWKFHIVSKPSERPTDFYKKNYDVSKWSEIPVPANWQTVGKDSYIFTALCTGRIQSCRILQAQFPDSCRMENQRCIPPLRRRQFIFLLLDQRSLCRLQQRQ
jgi:hypothetical protein